MSKRINPIDVIRQNSPAKDILTQGAKRDYTSTQLYNVTEAPLPGAELRKINIDEIEAAPPEWNFFADQSQDSIMNLAVSLLNEGQLSPIIVRAIRSDNQTAKWQCLAGHTRLKAAALLLKEGYTDWQYLHAFAYAEGNCSDIQARRMIVHSNTEQRHSMTPEERQACFIFEFMDETNAERNQNAAELTKKLMERHGIKRSHAYNLRNIGTNIIPSFLEKITAGTVSIRNAVYLSRVNKDTQQYLEEKYADNLNGKSFKEFIGKNRKDIDTLFVNDAPDISSRLKIVDETAKDITFTVHITKKAEDSFRKAMHRIFRKYGTPTEK